MKLPSGWPFQIASQRDEPLTLEGILFKVGATRDRNLPLMGGRHIDEKFKLQTQK